MDQFYFDEMNQEISSRLEETVQMVQARDIEIALLKDHVGELESEILKNTANDAKFTEKLDAALQENVILTKRVRDLEEQIRMLREQKHIPENSEIRIRNRSKTGVSKVRSKDESGHYECQFCPQVFRNPGNLANHEKKHRNSANFIEF